MFLGRVPYPFARMDVFRKLFFGKSDRVDETQASSTSANVIPPSPAAAKQETKRQTQGPAKAKSLKLDKVPGRKAENSNGNKRALPNFMEDELKELEDWENSWLGTKDTKTPPSTDHARSMTRQKRSRQPDKKQKRKATGSKKSGSMKRKKNK